MKQNTWTTSNTNPINQSKLQYYITSKLLYVLGAPNYWYEDLDITKRGKTIHYILTKLIDLIAVMFFISLWGSSYTQHNLSEKQKTDTFIFSITNPILYIFVPVMRRNAEKVREVAYNLCVKMKETYNDEQVERQMIKRAKVYFAIFVGFVVVVIILYGLNGILQVILKDGTFVTIILAWPDIDDRTIAAGIGRTIAYLLWFVLTMHVVNVAYSVMILMTISLSHQYKNLCSYFHSLNDIFEDETLSHEEQEIKYEEAFKVGIEMHSNTLRCKSLIQEICNIIFSIQIFMNVSTLIISMLQMVNSARSMTSLLTTVMTVVTLLISTGCLWWNAGDITVEASNLPTAMYSSGWQHCRGAAARRMRPVVVIAMSQGQVPVELCCLRVVTLSYNSYVSIVKTSYSVFSVFY